MVQTMKHLLLLPVLAFPCSKPRVFGGWKIIPGSERIDSAYVDGRLEAVAWARASANMVCLDSVAIPDTTKKKK